MLRPILIVEDNPNDLQWTLNTLEKSRLANEIIVMRDGEQAADYLFRRGTYADRATGNPEVVLLDLKLARVDELELLKMVRASEEAGKTPVVLLNEPPRGSARVLRNG